MLLPVKMRYPNDIPVVLGQRAVSAGGFRFCLKKRAEELERILSFERERHEPVAHERDADGWVPWHGGKCPIDANAGGWEYKLTGSDRIRVAHNGARSLDYIYYWSEKAEYRITAYRLRAPTTVTV